MFKIAGAVLTAVVVSTACGGSEDPSFTPEVGSASSDVRGGNDTAAQSWLGSIQIRSGNQWFHICAGTLVNDRTLMTAAHCVQGDGFRDAFRNNRVRVCLGVRDSSNCPSARRVLVTGRRVHPRWNPEQVLSGFDVAVLRLGRGFPSVRKVRLAQGSQNPSGGRNAFLRGWGLTEEGVPSNILQGLSYSIVPNGICSIRWREDVPFRILCALATRQEGACNGDSGGPLSFQGRQVGIVSFGRLGCDGLAPDGYTRVSSVRGWVLNNQF